MKIIDGIFVNFNLIYISILFFSILEVKAANTDHPTRQQYIPNVHELYYWHSNMTNMCKNDLICNENLPPSPPPAPLPVGFLITNDMFKAGYSLIETLYNAILEEDAEKKSHTINKQ